MRMRNPFPFILSLLIGSLALVGSASAAIYVQATGSGQGPILGPVTAPGHVNEIEMNSFQFGIGATTGPTGIPTGVLSLSDVTMAKGFDRSSTKLMTALKNAERFTTLKIDFTGDSLGSPGVYFRVSLDDAYLTGFNLSSGGDRPSESLSLTYSSITLADLVLGTSITYLRTNPGPASIVSPDALAKGILLPPTPNPTRGEMQFRFSLPSDKDADLTLFDTQGRKVRELRSGRTSAGLDIAEWDGTDDQGAKVAPGMYMARLAYPGMVFTQRFAVIR